MKMIKATAKIGKRKWGIDGGVDMSDDAE